MEEESEEFDPQLYATKTPMQVFFSEFCEKFHKTIQKNTSQLLRLYAGTDEFLSY